MRREIAEKAVELLNTEGWQQGEYTNFDPDAAAEGRYRYIPCGPYCMVGAVAMATSLLDNLAWTSALSKTEASEYNLYVSWNDTPGRTKEEVINKIMENIDMNES
jgi:hypothetical protein